MSIWHPISASSFQNGKVNTPPFSKSLFSSYFSTNFVCVVLNDRSGRLSQKIFSGHEPNGITVFVNSILKLRCLINRTRVHDRLSSIYGRTRSHCWTPPPGANSSTEFVVQLVIIVRFVLVGGWRCSLPSNAFFFSFLPLEEWFDKSMWVTKLSSRRNILHIYKTMNSYEAKWVIFLRNVILFMKTCLHLSSVTAEYIECYTTGYITVRMTVDKQIPSTDTIPNTQFYIRYKGQSITCRAWTLPGQIYRCQLQPRSQAQTIAREPHNHRGHHT